MQLSDSFLEELRRPRPDPGGGAAAAHGALLGVALLEKIIRVEQARRTTQSQTTQSWLIRVERVMKLSETLLELRERDVMAYHALARELSGRARDPDAYWAALEEAISCPFRIMQCAEEVLALAAEVGMGCRPFLAADALVACELIGAAFWGAFHIALANVPLIPAEDLRQEWLERLSRFRGKGALHLNQVRVDLESRNAIGCR